MKKIVLMAMVMLSMTSAFAGNENELNITPVADAKAYDMSLNYNSLARLLDLNIEQADEIENIHDRFCYDMSKAAKATNAAERKALVEKAVTRDLRNMHYVLSDNQFNKYRSVLNTTFINRGLK
ncbi:MAG: hypothetical protein K5854_08160 [Prevotella sp.]|jgi:hypothetical protein|nr:hypothetical protein [Prevotella sp.]